MGSIGADYSCLVGDKRIKVSVTKVLPLCNEGNKDPTSQKKRDPLPGRVEDVSSAGAVEVESVAPWSGRHRRRVDRRQERRARKKQHQQHQQRQGAQTGNWEDGQEGPGQEDGCRPGGKGRAGEIHSTANSSSRLGVGTSFVGEKSERRRRGASRTLEPLSPVLRGCWPPYPSHFEGAWLRCGICQERMPYKWFQSSSDKQSVGALADLPDHERVCRSCDAEALASAQIQKESLKRTQKRVRSIEAAQQANPISDDELRRMLEERLVLLAAASEKEGTPVDTARKALTRLERELEGRGLFVAARDGVWFDWRKPTRRGTLAGPDFFARHDDDADQTSCGRCRATMGRSDYYLSFPRRELCESCLDARLRDRVQHIIREQQEGRCESARDSDRLRAHTLWTSSKLQAHVDRKMCQLPCQSMDYHKQLLHLWSGDDATAKATMAAARAMLERDKAGRDFSRSSLGPDERTEGQGGCMSNVLVLVTKVDVAPPVQQALFISTLGSDHWDLDSSIHERCKGVGNQDSTRGLGMEPSNPSITGAVPKGAKRVLVLASFWTPGFMAACCLFAIALLAYSPTRGGM